MNFCERENNYKCGVYVTSIAKKDIVMKVISNLLPELNKGVEIRNSQSESFIKYPNGNLIRIVGASYAARGQRFNGVIVESIVDKNTIDTIILPCLMPLRTENNMYDRNDNPTDRIYYCSIGKDDVIESEKYKTLISVSSGNYNNWEKYRRDMLDVMLYSIWAKNSKDKFEKEYECMFYENDYDRPVVEKELNGDKVMLYEAWGIPKGLITYSTEFINKTKQTYLNIVGKHKIKDIGFENDINVHLKIDTDIYDGYEVHIEDGLITVVLHEIKNEAPVLKDYGVA